MTIRTGSDRLDLRLNEALLALAQENTPDGGLLGQAARVREAAFHDFSSYRFLLSPHYVRRPGESPYPGDTSTVDGTDVSLGVWLDFYAFARLFDTDVQGVVGYWIQRHASKRIRIDDDYVRDWWIDGWEKERRRQGLYVSAKQGFELGMAPELFELYRATPRPDPFIIDAQEAVADWFRDALRDLRGADGLYTLNGLTSVSGRSFWEAGVPTVLSRLSQYLPEAGDAADAEESEEFGDNLPDAYPFEPFMPSSVNFGLQVIYRQGWIPLGTQPGEIVRTLPLGPKQTEKITVKAIRRTKATRQAEISSSVETSTESSAATKDSSEVIQEASESFNWHVEATASASFGFGSASVTAGAGGENSSSSKDTKSQLNETMEKTASKIRKDTKIVVTTEVEETSEFSQVSEITNPNDEIAVTYIYSRLQRQYEIQTYLSEVNQVIFVAEKIPAPEDIDGPWVRRYDWIIARELLDESFRSDLDAVRNHERDNTADDEVDPRIQGLMETISGDGSGGAAGIPAVTSLDGQIPDLYQNQQQAYEREVERKRAKEADQEQYRRSVRRLRGHIYDNILHYCRAIWSSEDPDARILRYQQIRVPIKWEFASTGSGPHTYRGYFVPSVRDFERDTAPLSELVNPAGPIGFAGNYSVFYLRQSSRWSSLLNMLRIVQAPYLAVNVRIDRMEVDPGIGIRAAVSDNIAGPGRFRLTYEVDDDSGPGFSVHELRDGNTWVHVRDVPVNEGGSVVFLGIRLHTDNVHLLSAGDRFQVIVTTQQSLEDPELKALRWSLPPLLPEQQAGFFSAQVIGRMRQFFTDVHLAYEDSPSGVSWDESTEPQRQILIGRYHDFILRDRHTRRILLDTNNLMLTREVDGATTLEPFKGLHRVFDVLSASEEVAERRLENERKVARLDTDQLGDPDIDKLTVVASVPGAAGLAALDDLQDDPDTDEDPDDGP